MECPKCTFDNPTGMKFCGNCGGQLDSVCGSCGFQNPPGFKFCGNCGVNLSVDSGTSITASAPEEPASTYDDGERRHLTVMFCDLVGSTEMSHILDPEDLKSIVKQYQVICSQVVNRFDGYIAQYLGDGILVYFGYPIAHENDAHRAVSAALGIIEAIELFNIDIQARYDVEMHVRLGIHTGHVVIGQMGGGDQTQDLALGAAPNIAARLEGLARPDSIVISQATYALVHRFFNCSEAGSHDLKGIDKPIHVYEVLSENVAKFRYESQLSTSDRKPLIGRDEEIMQLHALWELARLGESQIVLISGEPGLGKSMITNSVMRLAAEDQNSWLMFHQCSEYHTDTPFYPIAHALMHSALQYKPGDSLEEKISRLEGFLVQNGYDLGDMLPLFAQIMSLPPGENSYEPSQYSPDQQRQKLVDGVIYNFLRRSEDSALLLVFEDLQWMDSATLEIVSKAVMQAPTHKLMMVLTYRPEFNPPWRDQKHITRMPLSHLRSAPVQELITRIANGKQLPELLVKEIISKTDGVPLFVEELTKTILNSNIISEKDGKFVLQKPLTEISIPSTLHDSLEARLDRMSHTKEIAQVGATIGRKFEYNLVCACSNMTELATRKCLDELVDADLLIQNGMPPEATYQFRHALIMDAAYASLLKSNRVKIHAQVADSMEASELYTNEFPEAIAFHNQRAKRYPRAVQYWIKSAQKARGHSSYEEALAHTNKALSLLDEIASDQTIQLEIDIHALRAPLLIILEGFSSSRSFDSSARMYELAEIVDDDEVRFRALRSMIPYQVFTGESLVALENAIEAERLAISIQSTEAQIEALRLKGQASVYAGKLPDALTSFDAAFSLYESVSRDSVGARFIGADPGIFSLVQSSHCAWYLGFPDQAIDRGNRGIEMAKTNNAINTLAMSLFIQAINFCHVGEWQKAFDIAYEGIEISEKYGLQMFTNETRTLLGFVMTHLDQMDEGIVLMISGIDRRLNSRLSAASHMYVTKLADALIRAGRPEEAMDYIALSEELMTKNGDTLFRSQVFRIKALLLFLEGQDIEKVRQWFQKSLETAIQYHSPAFELRTLITMTEIEAKVSDPSRAVEKLKSAYDRYEEGFQTMDLRRAAELIHKYSSIPHASH